MNLNRREFDPAEGLVNGSWHCYWIMVGSRSGSWRLVWYGRTTAPREERQFLYTRIKFLHTKRVFVFLCVVWLHVERSSVYLAELLTLNPVNDELRPQPFVMQSERPSDQASQKSYTPPGVYFVVFHCIPRRFESCQFRLFSVRVSVVVEIAIPTRTERKL
jgi:hypothetical protein